MKNYLLISIFILSFVLKLSANGGPVDGSAVYKTGDIKLINTANIHLLKERLNIRIEGDYSIVNVEYVLANKGSIKAEITYGFPVEIMANDFDGLEWRDEYLPKIEFKKGDDILPLKKQIDISVFKSEDQEYSEDLKRVWHIVDFTLNKKEQIVLSVNYKVKNGFIDWSTSKDFFENYGYRRLIYDFSPAQYWGDGVIDSMQVVLDASYIVDNGGIVEVKGIDFTLKDGVYSFYSNDFDLKKAENLTLKYDNSIAKFSRYITKYNVTSKVLKKVNVTSQLKGDYGKENLFDSDFSTAWVEGEKEAGLNGKIILEVDDSRLGAICFINGYVKNRESYFANNRLKKLKLEVEYLDYSDITKTQIEEKIIELEDKPYVQTKPNNFYVMTNIIEDYGEGYRKIRKITFTILEVYKGSKYNDTCISEIFLLGY